MLSRIADSLFWMTRYMERTDGMLRMLRINFITSLDRSGQPDFSWEPVLQIFTRLPPEETVRMAMNGNEVLRYLIFDRLNDNSIRNIVARARENARGVQDHITKEVWECVNEFHLKLSDPKLEKAIDRDEQILMLGDLIQHYLLFCGVTDVTMPRGQGWNYMNLGRYIERAVQTADILDVRFGTLKYDLDNPADVPYWRNLLLSLSAYELYLKRYPGPLDGQNIAHLGILNAQFSRSLAYSVFRLETIIQHLSEEQLETSDPLKRLVGRLRAKVEFSDMDSITQQGMHAFLTEMKADFHQFSNALGRSYFGYN